MFGSGRGLCSLSIALLAWARVGRVDGGEGMLDFSLVLLSGWGEPLSESTGASAVSELDVGRD